MRTLNKARVAGAALGAAAVAGGVMAATNNKKQNQEKQAAVGLLVETGLDFDTAVELVEKKASELEKTAITNVLGGYLGAKKGDKVGGTATGFVTGSLAATPALHATGGNMAAGLAAAGVGGYLGGKLYSHLKHMGDKKPHRETEKKAAVGMLIEQGLDFETAVKLVEKKAAELA
jgi:hypothetical protein